MITFRLTETHGQRSAFIVYGDGSSTILPGTHPRFDEIVAALETPDTPDETIRELIDTAKQVKTFISLSERVSMRGGKLFFDGDRIRGQITKHIRRMIDAGDTQAGALVAFLEKVATNPSEQSRDALYRWLNDRDFTITPEGDFIAYKGVTAEYGSISHGTAWVDGVKHTGSIPNRVGAVVTMPRLKVDDNREVGCSQGLHAGTWGYASSFARGATLTVRINPRDVVSVPDDCAFQKLRVCRYVVIEAVDRPYDVTTWCDEGEGDDWDNLDAPDGDEPMPALDDAMSAARAKHGDTVRLVGPADGGTYETIDDFGTRRWIDADGELHTPGHDRFAMIAADGYSERRDHGVLHCGNGPARIFTDGREQHYVHGARTRTVFRDSEGRKHRDHGPAVLTASGRREWWREGKLHRKHGPAVIGAEQAAWYLDGKFVRTEATRVSRTAEPSS